MKQQRIMGWQWAVTAGVLLCVAACHPERGARDTVSGTQPKGGVAIEEEQIMLVPEDAPAGLTLVLAEGSPEAGASPGATVAASTPLAAAEVERLLKRLPPLEQEPADAVPFALREGSKPAPRPGATVPTPFPPPPPTSEAASAEPAGPLQVLRSSPEGAVPVVGQFSVTFDQPMVAVTSHATLAAAELPVKLSPQPAGQWRWLGTRTLIFQADPRFPMATAYQAEVPAGTRSATGGVLAKAQRFAFETPAPRVLESWPQDGPQSRDAIMFVGFDQRVDPQAVLATVKVTAGGKPVAVRLLDASELARDERTAQRARDGRWLAFRAVELLPIDTAIAVTVGPNTPSLEGPKRSTDKHAFGFRTYGPFKLTTSRCGWSGDCQPGWSWQLEMSNPIESDGVDPALVKVEPELPGMEVRTWGNVVEIQGPSRGRTTYTVTIDKALRDAFGQTLVEPAVARFSVGKAEPSLAAAGELLVVMDPASKGRFSVLSVNYEQLEVRAWRVTPEHWSPFLAYVQEGSRDTKPAKPPGELVIDRTVTVGGEPDAPVETQIDLSEVLKGGHGHVVLEVRPPTSVIDKLRRRWPPVIRRWIEATSIGVDAFVDDEKMVVWANRLADGKPIAGAVVHLDPGGVEGKTGADGTVELALPGGPGQTGRGLLSVSADGEHTLLPENAWAWSNDSGWVKRDRGEQALWYVADDRQMYKPKETVRVKGWIRRLDMGPRGDLALVGGGTVAWTARDSRGADLAKGSVPLSALGGFDLRFELPDTANLGHGQLELRLSGGDSMNGSATYHSFQIQEFRRPEFEVRASAPPGPHVVGSSATLEVSASYYAGGGLPNAETTWVVTNRVGSFVPPNRSGWVFGEWHPWWRIMEGGGETAQQTFTGRTDGAGAHRLRMDFRSISPPRAYTVDAEATVMDVNRQAWTARSTLLVHPADVYVGLRSPSTFVEGGQPISVEAIAVDLDGKSVAGKAMTLVASRLVWTQKKGRWLEEERDPHECRLTSAEDPQRCTFETGEGGRYIIRAEVRDAKGRKNQSQLTVWVSGGKRPPGDKLEQDEVELIPDRELYQPGDVAKILVISPFQPAEGLLTVRRSGLVSTQRFTVSGPTATVSVPIVEGFMPNVTIQVDLVGSAPRTGPDGKVIAGAPPRPAYAKGELRLPVPALQRTLAVEVTPAKAELEPGAQTSVAVKVLDAAGKPVSGAEVAVIVVDEAVLALTGYRLPDPIATFYPTRGADTRDHHTRQWVLLEADLAQAERPEERSGGGAKGVQRKMMMRGEPMLLSAPMAEGAMADEMAPPEAPGGGDAPIALRTNFDALALFAPSVTTDAQGRATVDLKVPDSLTRYRVMAVAVHQAKHAGQGESTLTARLPLMVRPSAPRFLNFGDRFDLPIVLQNQTDTAMTVAVAARASNATLTAGQGRSVVVPARDRVEVRLPAAAELPGTARFQIAASSGAWSDAATVTLPVWTPATTEAFATYGEVDAGAVAQPVVAPKDAVTSFGGLEITTSSTELQALTDAFLYLTTYPYDCAEQMASRVMGVAALRDVLTAFKADGLPSPEAIAQQMTVDLERLQRLQNSDGGWGFWRRGEESWPYLSVHVAHALVRAGQKGYDVPKRARELAFSYLGRIDRHFPAHYSEEAKLTIRAYALYVRNLGGDNDAKAAAALVKSAGGLEKLNMEAIAWLYPVLAADSAQAGLTKDLKRLLGNRVTETAGAAHFQTSYSDGAHLLLYSDRRVDAVLLEGLIADDPKSDLITKLVRGLLAHRVKGRWGNTQENVFVLLALDRYFNVFEAVTPAFVANIWLGDRFAGEHKFKGRSTERQQVDIPMAEVAKVEGPQTLTIAKEGKGRLYYRIGMRYAPKDLNLEASDHGFVVGRTYEAIDEPGDVRVADDGVWHVKAGARVRVRVSMVAPTRRYHVALVDPMPAGFEAQNPELAVSGSLPPDPNAQAGGGRGGMTRSWWWGPWYVHDNLRDERAEAFAFAVGAGVYEYTYVARATTPGHFVVPPPKAEEMYSPETFGRGASARVVVE
ncbi:MAG: alpha-2-macroglobulin family protein [Myxococcota bacterium]